MAAPASRIVALDALRGAGILGILAVHIQTFAMPLAARSNPTAYGELGGVAGAAWLGTYVLADGKFIAVFAMLFGAGIAMLAARREAAGLPAVFSHYRRMTALGLVGVLHAYLLWYGDMLVTFALCGALVFLHRDLSPARLIVAGVVFLAIAPLLSSVVAWTSPELVAHAAVLESPETIARELAAYRGGWLVQQGHRAPTAWEFQTSYLVFRGVWQASGLMLVGMGLFRLKVLTGERPARWYLALAVGGFGAGIPLMLAAVRRSFAHGWDPYDRMLVGVHLDYWGSLLVGLGWLGVILLFHRRGLVPHAVVAVGRTALSNYLFATLLCTTVFYGHGLGLFGAVERPGQLAVVGAVWAIQLVASSWWLGRFAAGPLEWGLRWATNGRPGPFKLTAAQPAGRV
jgi:uncharacterized protein